MSPWLPCGVFGFLRRDFELHLAPFGVHLPPLGILVAPLGSIWSPLGSIWLPLGVHLGAFGVPLKALGPFGGSLGCLGADSRFLLKNGLPIPGKWLVCPQPVSKSWPHGTQPRQAAASPGKRRISPKWRKGRSSQPHFSRRGLG